ncbi:uncharacterized protein [Solanum lycopersicum]|uniref:uncharacterized protein n=1 Tax=Solanum lycopersicum TaxID=4081 RepID=UPI003749D9C4
MYFDGAAHRGGAGTGIVFITLQEEILPFSYTLKQCCSNNVAEYELIEWLGDVTLQHVRRTENKRVDALTALASTLTLLDQIQVTIFNKWIVPPPNEEEYIENEFEHLISVSKAAEEDWRQPIIDYMCYGILPENPKIRTNTRRRAPRFLYYKDTLYRRSFEGVLLLCLGEQQAIQALQEAHSGV